MATRLIHFLIVINLCFGVISTQSYAAPLQQIEECSANRQMTALYTEGKAALDAKQWEAALRKFLLLNFKYPTHPYREETQISIIQCIVGKKEFDRALVLIDEFIEQYSEGEWRNEGEQLKKEIKQKKNQVDFSSLLPVSTWFACIVCLMTVHHFLPSLGFTF